MDLNAAALVQDNVSAIECRFAGGGQNYTYLVGWPLKETDTHAIVHTGNEGLKVVTIKERVEVPVGSSHQLRFVVATFGVDDNKDAVDAHNAVVKQIADAVRRNARAAFKREMDAVLLAAPQTARSGPDNAE